MQKPLRSTLPQVRFLQTDSDKSSPAQELPSSGSDTVRTAPCTRFNLPVSRLFSLKGMLTGQFKINLPDESFHSYRCDAPALEVDVSKDELVDMYTKMVRVPFSLA